MSKWTRGWSGPFSPFHALIMDLDPATAEMVAASQETGAAERTTNSPRSPYEAVTATDSVFFTVVTFAYSTH